jgi:hypothetical protein
VSVHILRQTAALMLEQHGPDHPRHEMWAAMAAWVRWAGADLWAHGPLPCDCAKGCDECDDLLWAPHVRHALAVASAYRGEPT